MFVKLALLRSCFLSLPCFITLSIDLTLIRQQLVNNELEPEGDIDPICGTTTLSILTEELKEVINFLGSKGCSPGQFFDCEASGTVPLPATFVLPYNHVYIPH